MLVFSRKTIAAHDSSAPQSPPLADRSPKPSALFGSVSAEDVAAEIRTLLRADDEASRIRVDARDVRFFGVDEGADRVKTLGRWAIEIAVRDASGDPVRRVVEVVAQE